MNVGSLFTGIGGIDLGLERAGHRIVFQCEADEWRRTVLAAHFPDCHAFPDVRGIGRERGRNGPRDADCVDLLCGGFPCQDLSIAGRRAGLIQGERSSLFFEFARVADELVRPGGYVLVENVPGLLSSNGGRDFAVVLATLADIGFHDLAWRVLDSRHFGVPQRRRRVFIVGRRARGDSCAKVLLEPESGGGHFATSGEARSESSVASLSGLGSGGPDDNDAQQGRIVGTMTARDNRAVGADLAAAAGMLVADTLTSGSHPGSNMPGRRREDDTNIVAYALRKDPGGTGQGHNTNYIVAPSERDEGKGAGPWADAPAASRSEDAIEPYTFDWQAGGSKDESWRGKSRQWIDDKPGTARALVKNKTLAVHILQDPISSEDETPALAKSNKTGTASIGVTQGSAVRRLTPRECERLQGFPDDWTAYGPDSRRYAALGDAVTVPVAEWIGRRLAS